MSDFDYELQMAQMNRRLGGVDTVFMSTNPQYSFLSSRAIKKSRLTAGTWPVWCRTSWWSGCGEDPAKGVDARWRCWSGSMTWLRWWRRPRACRSPVPVCCRAPELLDLIDEIRDLLPESVRDAEIVVNQRDDILDDAQREADAIVSEAEQRAGATLDEADRLASARRADSDAEAERILAEARTQSALIIDSHTITVTARDEANQIVEEAKDRAAMVVTSTQHRATTLFAKAEQSLASALDEVQRSLTDLESPAHHYIVDLDADNPSPPADGNLTHVELTGEADEDFYDFGDADEFGGAGAATDPCAEHLTSSA